MPVSSVKLSTLQAWKQHDSNRVPDSILDDIDLLDGKKDGKLTRWTTNGCNRSVADAVSTGNLSRRANHYKDAMNRTNEAAHSAECNMSKTPEEVSKLRKQAKGFKAEMQRAQRVSNWMKTIGCAH